MNPIKTYINNQKKTPFYPTPTGTPIKNTVGQKATAPTPTGKPLGAPQATYPQSTPITPQKTQYPMTKVPNGQYPMSSVSTNNTKITSLAGQDYLNSLKTTAQPTIPQTPTNGVIPPPTNASNNITQNPITTSKTQYLDAYKSYIDSLKESADVKEAKTAYLDFVKSKKEGLQNIEDQTIPMQFITGQQRSLENRATDQEANLLGRVQLEQDSQKATQESLKAGVDMFGKQLELEKPIEVGGKLYKVKDDGTYEEVANSTGKEGFTLGKDQVRYEINPLTGQYEPINGGGGAGISTSYSPGSDPQADAWVKYVQNGGKITEVPDEYQNAVAQGITTQAKPQSEISRTVSSVIDELLADPTSLNKIAGPIDQFIGGILDPKAILAKNKYNQLKGLLSLDNIKYLKGTGAISDAEQRLLANAASAIGRNLYGTQLIDELNKLKEGLTVAQDGQLADDEIQYLKSKGYTDEQIKSSFNSVGNTSASSLSEAIAKQESGNNYNAVSPAGALGKYQLMPATIKGLGYNISNKDFLSNPKLQEEAHGKLITELDKRYSGNLDKILADYYGGPNAAKIVGTDKGNNPQISNGKTFPSINQYVAQVKNKLNIG